MDRPRFIVAGNFIDGTGADVRRNVFLAVKDCIITAIGPAADLPRDAGAVIDDFSHCTIVPALVDCSVSLSHSPSLDRKVQLSIEEAGFAKKSALVTQHIRYCHSHGVLGVADSDDSIGLGDHLQEVMPQGSIINIRTSGELYRSRQDCAAGRAAGSDFLKIVYSENLGGGEAYDSGLESLPVRNVLFHRVRNVLFHCHF